MNTHSPLCERHIYREGRACGTQKAWVSHSQTSFQNTTSQPTTIIPLWDNWVTYFLLDLVHKMLASFNALWLHFSCCSFSWTHLSKFDLSLGTSFFPLCNIPTSGTFSSTHHATLWPTHLSRQFDGHCVQYSHNCLCSGIRFVLIPFIFAVTTALFPSRLVLEEKNTTDSRMKRVAQLWIKPTYWAFTAQISFNSHRCGSRPYCPNLQRKSHKVSQWHFTFRSPTMGSSLWPERCVSLRGRNLHHGWGTFPIGSLGTEIPTSQA